TWTREAGRGTAFLRVRPLLGPRDPHGTHHVNDAIDTGVVLEDRRVIWRPYDGVPAIAALATGSYEHGTEWFHRVLYLEERARGLDDREDVFSPGELSFELGREPAGMVIGVADALAHTAGSGSARDVIARLTADERARRGDDPLLRARDAYVVRGDDAPAILAGYPWFGEWGRDTFIAMRGLCLATDRLEEAAALLEGWTHAVSEGMLPNRFPDRGGIAEYNSVDASLWFGVVACELVAAAEQAGRPLAPARVAALLGAIDAIVAGYCAGTRHGIRVDDDGLVAAGEPGVQLTWMDAKVGDWVVTPRIGKPVEVQALWLNLLALASQHRPALAAMYERGRAAFARFSCSDRDHLYDVIDVDHERGRCDATLRPNQIYAVGGLPVQLVEGERALAIVTAVERALLTPIGLRTLAPGEPGYAARYEGDVLQRDGAYHQGTVWPHLLGPFIEAWLRVHGDDAEHRADARARFMVPWRDHLVHAGLGHVSEIADAEPPHTPRGAPFQAWGLGELLRIERLLTDADRG
ncbi:MAG: glycogen debranching enzyme N-terminal domain-containing protein, partial [Deltaproteobacteria bacterium]|nr:glycogen debranching enzyme N-terminal domain-containing protein [Nannocystaceae bacterium]